MTVPLYVRLSEAGSEELRMASTVTGLPLSKIVDALICDASGVAPDNTLQAATVQLVRATFRSRKLTRETPQQ